MWMFLAVALGQVPSPEPTPPADGWSTPGVPAPAPAPAPSDGWSTEPAPPAQPTPAPVPTPAAPPPPTPPTPATPAPEPTSDPAEAPGTDPDGTAPTPPDDDLPPFTGEAERLDGISKEQHEFLEPKRHLLEQNPYAQIDFTAYTLEWGEVELGITGLHFGIAPRVQIGSQPLFDLLGLYNGNLKADIVRVGPVDVGLLAQGTFVPLGDFKGTYAAGGLNASWIAVPKWSLHAGVLIGGISARGIPNAPPALFRAWVPQDQLDDLSAEIDALGFEPEFKASAILWRFATDYRLNRRDSLVLQAQGLGYASVNANLGDDLDPVAAEIVEIVMPFASDGSFSDAGNFNPAQAYCVTLSWQFAWQQIGLRLGGGWSADQLSWLVQGNDLNYRFWGKTRLEDRRRKKGWKESKEQVVE